MIKVLTAGAIIAVLSYLFHPGAGQFSVMLNNEPAAEEPLVRFAVPTFLLIMIIAAGLVYHGTLFLAGLSRCCTDDSANDGRECK